MKKLSIFLVIIICLTLIGCNKNNGLFEKYSYLNPEVNNLDNFDLDENINVDGILDEDVWTNNRNWFEDYSVSNGKAGLKSTIYLADGGLYLAAEVKDYAIYYSKDRSITANSSVEFYLAQRSAFVLTDKTVEITITANNKSLVRRGNNASSYYSYPMNILTATTIQGELNTSNNEGYRVEAFIPYSVIGLTEKPSYVNSAIALVRSESWISTTRDYWTWLSSGSWGNPLSWEHYNENGLYELPIGENMGSVGKYTYTAGFDVSGDKGNNPYTDNIGGGVANIYFKNLYSSTFFVETEIEVYEVIAQDKNPKIGFIFRKEEDKSPIMYMLDLTDTAQVKGILTTHADAVNGKFTYELSDPQFFEKKVNLGTLNVVNGKVKLGVYRIGDSITYFVNDKKLTTITGYENFTAEDKTYAGFYLYNLECRFSNYQCIEGEQATAYVNSLNAEDYV